MQPRAHTSAGGAVSGASIAGTWFCGCWVRSTSPSRSGAKGTNWQTNETVSSHGLVPGSPAASGARPTDELTAKTIARQSNPAFEMSEPTIDTAPAYRGRQFAGRRWDLWIPRAPARGGEPDDSCSASSCRMRTWHAPHPVPAWHERPTCATERAPRSMESTIMPSDTAWQLQTNIQAPES